MKPIYFTHILLAPDKIIITLVKINENVSIPSTINLHSVTLIENYLFINISKW
jgi:hypothetical protein